MIAWNTKHTNKPKIFSGLHLVYMPIVISTLSFGVGSKTFPWAHNHQLVAFENSYWLHFLYCPECFWLASVGDPGQAVWNMRNYLFTLLTWRIISWISYFIPSPSISVNQPDSFTFQLARSPRQCYSLFILPKMKLLQSEIWMMKEAKWKYRREIKMKVKIRLL